MTIENKDNDVNFKIILSPEVARTENTGILFSMNEKLPVLNNAEIQVWKRDTRAQSSECDVCIKLFVCSWCRYGKEKDRNKKQSGGCIKIRDKWTSKQNVPIPMGMNPVTCKSE